MKAPWDCGYVLYPPPHSAVLGVHYATSISNAMKGNGDDYELDDDDGDDDDYEELSEPEEVPNNERVKNLAW